MTFRDIGVADRALNAVCRPIVNVWLRTAEMSDPLLPRPEAPDRREPMAHHTDRVLLVGNGAAVGYGVLSHDLSLAGHLARQISQVTGRPTHVRAVADSTMTAGSATASLGGVDLDEYDGIVFTVGVNEALSLSSVKRWDREVDDLLRYLRPPTTSHLKTFMVAIPPMDSIAAFPRFVGWITERHARTLDARLRAACDRFDQVEYVPFTPDRSVDLGRYRSTETYRDWATLISAAVAKGISAECPRDDAGHAD